MVLFLYFPAAHLLQTSALLSKPGKHEHSDGPVPPAAPNEFAVHALHVVFMLKPALCVFSGHMTHTCSVESAYPGLQTQEAKFELPVISVVKVSGHTVQL